MGPVLALICDSFTFPTPPVLGGTFFFLHLFERQSHTQTPLLLLLFICCFVLQVGVLTMAEPCQSQEREISPWSPLWMTGALHYRTVNPSGTFPGVVARSCQEVARTECWRHRKLPPPIFEISCVSLYYVLLFSCLQLKILLWWIKQCIER